MQNNDLVSSVVITFNQADIVINTLNGIYDQTYKSIELVVSDDCSTDDTKQVIEDWVSYHKDRFTDVILCFSDKNTGVTKNVNRGIKASHGKWIHIIGGDDVPYPDCIESQLDFAQEHNLDWVVSDVEIYSNSVIKRNDILRYKNEGLKAVKGGWKEQYRAIQLRGIITGPAGAFKSRKLIEEMGYFDESYPMIEDYPFVYKYICKGNELVYFDHVCTRYNLTEKSLSSSHNVRFEKSASKFFFTKQMWGLLKNGMRKEMKTLLYNRIINVGLGRVV